MKKLDKFLASDGGAFTILVVAIVMLFFSVAIITGMLLGEQGSGEPTLSHLRSGVWVQAITGITTSIAAGLYFFQRLRATRFFIPHLDISHKISHRAVGDDHLHIAVTSVLYNSSRVRVMILNGFSRIQQIVPMISEEDIKKMCAQICEDAKCECMRWPTIKKIPHSWEEDELILEPGESRSDISEFVISNDIRTVRIHTFFWKRGFSEGSPYLDSPIAKGYANGWGETSVYDID